MATLTTEDYYARALIALVGAPDSKVTIDELAKAMGLPVETLEECDTSLIALMPEELTSALTFLVMSEETLQNAAETLYLSDKSSLG